MQLHYLVICRSQVRFADINVSQGSVATYTRCGGIFNMRLTANLPRNLLVNNFVNRLRFDRIMVASLWPRFLAHPVDRHTLTHQADCSTWVIKQRKNVGLGYVDSSSEFPLEWFLSAARTHMSCSHSTGSSTSDVRDQCLFSSPRHWGNSFPLNFCPLSPPFPPFGPP